jgi:hypothetical protein
MELIIRVVYHIINNWFRMAEKTVCTAGDKLLSCIPLLVILRGRVLVAVHFCEAFSKSAIPHQREVFYC